MSKAIVDGLETVDVEVEHSQLIAPAFCGGNGLEYPVLNQGSIGKVRKRVEVGQKLDSLFGEFSLSNIDQGTFEYLTSAVLFADGSETAQCPSLRSIEPFE